MARLLLALALFAAGTDAFLLPFAPRTATAPLRAAVSMGLEEAADKCIEEGCPIDLVDELIAELKGERPYPAPLPTSHLARAPTVGLMERVSRRRVRQHQARQAASGLARRRR